LSYSSDFLLGGSSLTYSLTSSGDVIVSMWHLLITITGYVGEIGEEGLETGKAVALAGLGAFQGSPPDRRSIGLYLPNAQ
jgi:hypothetical protein